MSSWALYTRSTLSIGRGFPFRYATPNLSVLLPLLQPSISWIFLDRSIVFLEFLVFVFVFVGCFFFSAWFLQVGFVNLIRLVWVIQWGQGARSCCIWLMTEVDWIIYTTPLHFSFWSHINSLIFVNSWREVLCVFFKPNIHTFFFLFICIDSLYNSPYIYSSFMLA